MTVSGSVHGLGSAAPKPSIPEELVFPTGVTKEQSQQESAVAMTTSQENAVAAALKELGIPFEQKMQIAGVPEGSASTGKLRENDVLVSVNGKPATALSVVQDELAARNGSRWRSLPTVTAAR